MTKRYMTLFNDRPTLQALLPKRKAHSADLIHKLANAGLGCGRTANVASDVPKPGMPATNPASSPHTVKCIAEVSQVNLNLAVKLRTRERSPGVRSTFHLSQQGQSSLHAGLVCPLNLYLADPVVCCFASLELLSWPPSILLRTCRH